MAFLNPSAAVGIPPSSVSYAQAKPLLKWVYTWMFIGLLVTAVVAAFTASVPALVSLAANPAIAIGAFVVQIILVIALSGFVRKLSPTMAGMMFLVYTALLGFSLSLIFLAFSLGSIAVAFGTTAILFGTMTMFAFTTDVDLTKFGGILMVGLIGVVIAIVVNMFLQSSALEYLISIIGVVLFMALTAYDTQKLKVMAAVIESQGESAMIGKYAIYGALNLYLDFLNIFLFLLRLMGGGSSD